MPNDQDDRPPTSRYVVGIDLGTTNSALAYVDTHANEWQVEVLSIPQLVAPFQVEPRETLPSFHYQATSAEEDAGALKLPWSPDNPRTAVGVMARDEGTSKPGRMIASAKSWLCHAGVDRTAELLPWQGDDDVERLSPVAVTSRYLGHLREAWQQAFPNYPLAEQDLVITLPASFDEVARELTIAAAKLAELPRVMLIEEPQAAFYAWVDRHAGTWREQVSPGQKILVCDIGGGTSDFTLIRVRTSDRLGDVEFHRVAVGEHLILGGDNLDLALARHVEERLAGNEKLPAEQWDVLVRIARRAKETLLGPNAPESLTLNLPSKTSKLIGGSLQVEVTREEAEQVLVEGFLPRVPLTERPTRRQSGFQDFGLPYAADPGITRYLATFLEAHRLTGDEAPPDVHDPARPDIVLFNGGFFASPMLRERLLDVLASWFNTTDTTWKPLVLDHARLDLAVARGAAYYGMVRRGAGVGITATLARSYYVGVGGALPKAVCLAPGSAAAGQDFELPNSFQLTLAEPVEFPLYVSSTRLTDAPGTVVDIDPVELTALPPIRTVLDAGRKREPATIDARLHAHLSEIGSLELSCRDTGSNRSWRLQFDIRSTTQTDLAAHESQAEGEGIVDDETIEACRHAIAKVFGDNSNAKPSQLIGKLAEAIGSDRHAWPTSLLRRVWELLLEHEPGRRLSPQHEARWLNLAGYALRPGYGFAVDDWRVAETWRNVRNRLAFPASQAESLILWRRIAGGLTTGQQLTIAEPLLASTRGLHRRFTGGKSTSTTAAIDPAQSAEVWRLLGSLELLPVPVKTELGNAIVDLLPKRKLETVRSAMLWTLGRLGQRAPIYGPLNTLVPPSRANQWVDAVMDLATDDPIAPLVAMQLARTTGDRHRDLEQSKRDQVARWLEAKNAANHLVELVRTGGTLDEEERSQVFGESLPVGLRLT